MKLIEQIYCYIEANRFTVNWYDRILAFAEESTDKKTAKKITNAAFKELWRQKFVRNRKESKAWHLLFLWLYIVCALTPGLTPLPPPPHK